MAFLNGGQFASYTKSQQDAFIQALGNQWNGALTGLNAFRNFLAAHPDADFTAVTGSGPIGYDATTIANIRSAFATDGGALYDIYTGVATLGTARDFRAFLKLLVQLQS